MVKLSVVGKTNTGKSTFFKAATLVDVEISNRIFTTIKPNVGVAAVRTGCVCKELGVKCNKCKRGIRLVPIKLNDIAGLVPGAHEGRGLGNQFLSDIMESRALIHVVDASGGTDAGGNPVAPGTHDPAEDIDFLEREIDYWMLGLLKKDWKSIAAEKDKFISVFQKRFSGLGVSESHIEQALSSCGLKQEKCGSWTDKDMLAFVSSLRRKAKPMIVAANKIDVTEENLKKIKEKGVEFVPCSAEVELALREAAEKKLVEYLPGDSDFSIIGELDNRQKKALEFIKKFLKKHKTTGVQDVIDKAVFNLLNMIVVYPVANENKYTDSKGNILPDAFLVPKGTTAKEFAFYVHEDIGKKFIAAINAKTKQTIAANHVLEDGDVIAIRAGK